MVFHGGDGFHKDKLNRKENYISGLVKECEPCIFKEEILSFLVGHGDLEIDASGLLLLQYPCYKIPFQKDSPGETRISLFREFSGGKSTLTF